MSANQKKSSCSNDKNSNQKPVKDKIATKQISSIRKGSKIAKLVEMLKSSNGATIKQIAEKLEWQNHTTRGALSRLRKNYDVNITDDKASGKNRIYKIA